MLMVQKYGGTSLADGKKILAAAQKVAAAVRGGDQVVPVVSAMGHTTDRLLALARELDPCPAPRELDACMALGEQLSAGLMALALGSLGLEAVSLAGWQAGLRTDGNHGDARLLELGDRRIRRELDRGRIPVVAGFQGINGAGDVTTLGRGGSDTTAVALAAWLEADRCRIYTDVDGVYDRDPRLYPEAARFQRVSYDHMLRLCRGGAQVLHDRSVELARDRGILLQVLSAFTDGPGTLVGPF